MKMLERHQQESRRVRRKIEVGMVPLRGWSGNGGGRRYRMWQLANPCFSRYRWWYSSAG